MAGCVDAALSTQRSNVPQTEVILQPRNFTSHLYHPDTLKKYILPQSRDSIEQFQTESYLISVVFMPYKVDQRGIV